MRTIEERRKILELWEQGFSKKSISRQTSISRATVRGIIRKYQGALSQLVEEIDSKPIQSGFESQGRYQNQAYAYILGMYLGDGYISKEGRTFRLRIFLCDDYPGIIQECVKALQELFPQNKVGIVRGKKRGRVQDIYVYSNRLPQMFPQFGQGRKHRRLIQLEDWQRGLVEQERASFVRGLLHSDGCRYVEFRNGGKYEYVMYDFCNKSSDIVDLFRKSCESLGISYTLWQSRTTKAYHVRIRSRNSVEILEKIVGPKS